MKRFLKGFTLAEILVTLSIVGIIASVTLPSLNVNAQKQQIGPSLAKAINTLEAATRMAIQQEQVRKLSDIPSEDIANPDLFTDILGSYMNLTRVPTKPEYTYAGTTPIGLSDADFFQSPDGIWYLHNNAGNPSSFIVYVDINGAKPPNAGGKDLFALQIFQDGDVVAFGSQEHRAHTPRAPHHDTYCKNHILNWMTCGGSIVDNNYQVTYY